MMNAARTIARGAARHASFSGRGSAAVVVGTRVALPTTTSALLPNDGAPTARPTSRITLQCARPFSDGKTTKKVVVDVRRSSQREIWNAYLSGKTTAADLFAEIDLNYNGTISVQEINYFLDSVVGKEEGAAVVSDRAFETLQKLGEDHELDPEEFGGWLSMATGSSSAAEEESADPSQEKSEDSAAPAKDETEDAAKPAEEKKKVIDARHGLQRLVWDEYLSTGRHGSDLFLMIDLNKNGTISVEEIIYFLDSVNKKGVKEVEFDRLVALGNDHELDEEEFLEWLTDAAEIEEHGDARFGASGCTPGQW